MSSENSPKRKKASVRSGKKDWQLKRARGSSGCGYLLLVTITASTLLLFNGAIVLAIFNWYVPEESLFRTDIRFSQIALLFGPVVMILAQYWLYDLIVDRAEILDDGSSNGEM